MLLGIPMSAIVRDGFKDHAGMVGIVEQAIMEYTNDPAQTGPRANNRPTAPGGPKRGAIAAAKATIAAARQQLSPEDMAKQPCVDHRERDLTGHICANRDKCKRSHAATGVPCKHPATVKYGRCPDYFTKCQDTHPFPEEARKPYGSPQKGWNALKETSQTRR